MARFMDKETLASEADRLGVDLDGLTWPQKQKAVIKAQEEEIASKGSQPQARKPKPPIEPAQKNDEPVEDKDAEIARLKAELEHRPVLQNPVRIELGRNEVPNTIEDYYGKLLVASPEQSPTVNQRLKYEERLGYNDMDTEEISLTIGKNGAFDPDDTRTRKEATYRTREKNREVVANSTMPKIGAMISFNPQKDMFACATYNGKRGYLWTHQTYPNVKAALKEAGAYEKYKHRFIDNPNAMFYLGGSLICVDIDLTHAVLGEISAEARKNAALGL